MHKKLTKRRLLRYFLIFTATTLASLVLAVFIWSRSLPSVEQIDAREITQSTKIFDRTGTVLLYEINSGEKRTLVQPEAIPQSMKDATVAIEDERFYSEPAFDWQGILRAVFVNITRGQALQGASTITQQLARNAFLTSEKTITRKIKELILAVRLGKHYSKDQILWLYLNEIPYGPSTYGVEAASQAYFNKPAKDMDLAESALLAAIPRNPVYYAPGGNHVADLLKRKDVVLKKMLDLGKISAADYKKAAAEKIIFAPIASGIKAPHFVMAVQDYLIQKYGEDMVRKGGLKVTTTLDWDLQQAAEKSVADGAAQNEKAYNGKNAALIAQNATSGQILAMVGSRNYFDVQNEGNFNVVTQGLRQPGSSLKPFVYLAGFEKGYSPQTTLFDVPTEFVSNNSSCPLAPDYTNDNTVCFHPENFDHIFRGPVTLRNALAQSVNIPAVKMLYLVGLRSAVQTANSLGLVTLDNPDRYGLSLVLGGGAVHLSDLAEAYSVLADDGLKHNQTMIMEVKDSKGNILETYSDSSSRVVDSQNVREINDILSDTDARSGLFQNSLPLTVFPGYDVALKTGTSNDYRDAWTLGYTPSLVVGVWAGNNDNSAMKRQGSSILAAVPIWHSFMSEALKKQQPEAFPKPDPRTPEKPVLRGEYIQNNQVHSILYYVNRNDPTGPAPANPSDDAQFLNWETADLSWAARNINSLVIGQSVPTYINSPSAGPAAQISDPADGSFVGQNFPVKVSLSSGKDLSEVRVYWNQNLVYTAGLPASKAYNFIWQFTPADIGQQNSLEVEVRDLDGRTAKTGVIVYKQ